MSAVETAQAGPTNAGSPRINAEAIRAQFPVLQQILPNGQRPVYLDSGASAQKPQVVIDKEREVECNYYANAFRGRYLFGARIDDEMEAARAAIARFLNAPSPGCIAFTPGSTAALNMIAFGWGRRHVQAGDRVVVSVMEHHANFVPWQQLALQQRAEFSVVPVTADGLLDLDVLDRLLDQQTKVVALCGMSNVLGTMPPLKLLSQKAHACGAIFVVDGAQSVPHVATDVRGDGIDFLVFSGHKCYGPSGVGVVYGRKELLEQTEPILFGGHMVDQVRIEESTWASPPARFEAGTLPIVPVIALRTAIEFVRDIGFAAIHKQEQELLALAHQALCEVTGVKIYGPGPAAKGPIVSFTMDGAAAEDVAHLLDRKGVFVRHGHHCAMPLHNWLNVPATIRASFGVYTNADDIHRLADALRYVRQRLRLDD
ncbi:MAG: SufS family cysteine desulfurase [Planctomycetaceae bacterium]|nr:SufS family cysteine desulfurase [Planctomycetaceae bacterium]